LIALMPAAMAFVAALLLFSRDYARHARTLRRVRTKLIVRDDSSDDEFSRQFPNADFTTMQQTRHAIAQFFNVPVAKIHSTDTLDGDLEITTLEPSFHSFVVYHVLNVRNVQPQPFAFNTGNLNDIGDLVAEIQRVLDGIARSNGGKVTYNPTCDGNGGC